MVTFPGFSTLPSEIFTSSDIVFRDFLLFQVKFLQVQILFSGIFYSSLSGIFYSHNIIFRDFLLTHNLSCSHLLTGQTGTKWKLDTWRFQCSMPFSPKRCDSPWKEGFYSLNIIFRDFLLTKYHFPEFCIHWISFPGIFYSIVHRTRVSRNVRVYTKRAFWAIERYFSSSLSMGAFKGAMGWNLEKKNFFLLKCVFSSPGHFPGFSTLRQLFM